MQQTETRIKMIKIMVNEFILTVVHVVISFYSLNLLLLKFIVFFIISGISLIGHKPSCFILIS